MPGAAECLRAGDSTQEIWAKIESGKFDYPDPFSTIPSKTLPANIYMSKQEFTTHMDKLIPAPSVEINRNLLNLANGLWLDMNDNLYHAFSFVSSHFTTETLQNVYNLCGTGKDALLPWEIIGAAIYLQTGTPPEEISKEKWRDFVLLSMPETVVTISSLGACTVQENGRRTLFYITHFGRIDPQKLLDTAISRADRTGTTVTESL